MKRQLIILIPAITIIVITCFQAKAQTMIKKILIHDSFEAWTADFNTCFCNEKLTLRNSVLY
ncbi:MAG: hypothetical protein ACP5QD_01530, partial [Candidatus Ratteibacteria bacterium]